MGWGIFRGLKKPVKRATNWAKDKIVDPAIRAQKAILTGGLSEESVREGAKNVATFGMYGEAKAAREMQEQQYKEQQAAAALALTDAKKAEQTAIAEAAAKTEEERRKRILYGRASTFVSSGLGGSMSSRKTLLGA